ncbi:MAG TPA: hypothetical protein VJ140_05040 [Actinomycetota bacterium]|nr:hypothetical protein [Actinomycetota bacterium]
MTRTRTFTVAELEGLEVYPGSPKVLANVEGEQHRWYTDRYLTFEHDGAFWRVTYMEPASEQQEGQATWDSRTDDAADGTVEADEVRRAYALVETWEQVTEEEPSRKEPSSFEDLLSKMEWEGGLSGGLDYGLGPDDLSAEAREQHPEAAAAWDKVCAAYAAFDHIAEGEWAAAIRPIEEAMEAALDAER